MNASQIVALTDRNPRVDPDELISGLVPPPHFESVSFDSYRPDPAQPSQAEARDTLRDFVTAKPKQGMLARLLDRKSTRLNSSHSGESRMPSSA